MAGRRRTRRTTRKGDHLAVIVLALFVVMLGTLIPPQAALLGVLIVGVGWLVAVVWGKPGRRRMRRAR